LNEFEENESSSYLSPREVTQQLLIPVSPDEYIENQNITTLSSPQTELNPVINQIFYNL